MKNIERKFAKEISEDFERLNFAGLVKTIDKSELSDYDFEKLNKVCIAD